MTFCLKITIDFLLFRNQHHTKYYWAPNRSHVTLD